MKSWDQQEGEPDDAYKAFRIWIEHRNFVRNTSEFCLVLRDSGVQFSRKTIETYRLRYQWRKRVAAYENWLRRKTERRISEIAAKNRTLILEKRAESTLKAVTMALAYLDQLPQAVTEDAVSRTIANIVNAVEAVRKIMDAIGMGCIDADDLREELEGLLTRQEKAVPRVARSPDPEELCRLPGESDEIQSGNSEAS